MPIQLSAISRNYREIGDTSLITYLSEFTRTQSPMLATAAETHAAAEPMSALFLAQAWLENRYKTTGHIIKPEHNNPVSLRPWSSDPRGLPPGATGTITAPDGGQFLMFASDADCAREWRYRLTNPAYKHGIYTTAQTLADMLAIYAPAGDVHPVTGVDNADIGYADVVTTMLWRFASMEDTAMSRSRPYVIISAGHRSTQDPGNPTEKSRTDELARAYTDAFRDAGFRADWFQRDLDHDSNPDQTIGSLATVAVGVRKAVEAAPEDLVIAMELHYDGGHSVVHTIVPDNVGLRSAMAGGDIVSDTAANNTLDVALAQQISMNIVYATGLGIYGGARLGKLGVMSERDTGVAQSGNWRLGFFGGTAQVRMKAVRLIIEHAGWADAETLKPGFEGKCAQAAVNAVNDVLNLEPPIIKPEEPETPEEPGLNYPPGMDRALAIRLFDQATGDNDVIYGFDERGPVSNFWLSEGKRTGQFPALTDVWNYDDGDGHWRRYFRFANGMVVLDTDTSGLVTLGDASLVVDALKTVHKTTIDNG